ncbi:MAG: TonB-dependent receptor [Proteobacteria bacterium]|nr:TonB-dependent receptor [Burkholderiales bacterium]
MQDLAELSLEQLSNMVVTSVSLRAQPWGEAPASIYVITSEDIRRSGVTSLPEALRLAPNLHVARADANQYAISARGFNNVLANKMLVLIDGRTVYSPLFSGVFWEVQQVMLEDVARIEVISGPGTTLWGANAVNGVINVITRPAGETTGALVSLGAGNRDQTAAVRWGGKLGERGHYRVYGTFFDRQNTMLTNGTPVFDASETGQGGFRADWGEGGRRFTVQGDVYRNDIEQQPGGSRDQAGGNLLARWTETLNDGGSLRLQAYYDRTERRQPGAILERLDTYDVEFNHALPKTARHQLLWGAGYRLMHDDLDNLGPGLAFRPANQTLNRANVFAQDEIALGRNLSLTLGLKLEHNNYTGWEYLPNARLGWRLAADRLLWTSLSRAVRSPSRFDREFFVPANAPFAVAGGPNFQSEVANVVEVGYRAQPTPALSYSMTAFHHDFDRLRTYEPRVGGALVENRMDGLLNGVNGWGSYRVTNAWKLTGGFVKFNQKLSLEPGSASIGGTAAAGSDPTHWWQIGTSLDLTSRHEFDLRVRRVGAIATVPVPAYTAVDARFGWKVSRQVELSLTVQNLLDPGHPEFGPPANRAEIERSVFVKLVLRD